MREMRVSAMRVGKMLKDSFRRTIDYARISLTDKCNMRCRYCMPEEGVKKRGHDELLKFEEIYFLIDILKELGVNKFRFTGGEPFVKRNAMEFFEGLNIGEFNITTNLSLDNQYINRLNNLNLGGINISLDTLSPEKYTWLTKGGDLNRVLENIRNLKVKNIKLNAVIIKDFSENEIEPLIKFATETGATMRFIEKMNFLDDGLDYAPLDKIRDRLIEENIIIKEKTTPKNSAAVYHQLQGGKGKVGFIMPVSKPFCENCGRIRLTSDGKLKLCLFAKNSLNLRDLVREGKDKEEIKQILIKTVLAKPLAKKFDSQNESMSDIGG